MNHLRRLLTILSVLFILTTSGLTILYGHVRKETKHTFTTQQSASAKVINKKPISVLVMGTDVGALNRGNTGGNTDTLELITINPIKKSILITSIPRDTLVKIKNKSAIHPYAKINSAYQTGGAKQTVKQVKELLNIPIDYYAVVNMGVLKKVVNSVNGVSVDNPFAFNYEGHYFPKGEQHLDGNLALKYSRMRYDDPNNDYGRQKRQQQIIVSIIKQFKRHGSAESANEIINAIGKGVVTNVPINDIEPLYDNYHLAMEQVSTDHLQGEDANVNDTAYQIVDPKELRRVSNKVRKQLNLSDQPLLNNETDLYDERDQLESIIK